MTSAGEPAVVSRPAAPAARARAGPWTSPWAVAGVVFATYGLWLAAMFLRGYDARDSIVLGTKYVSQSHVSSSIRLDPHYSYPPGGYGYDGQFFYFIAADPVNARYYMDSASYRYTKILYPMVARALALGRAEWVPYTLILTNWLAIAGGAGLLGAWLRRRALSPWFALVYALCPGTWVSFERDLTEPLSYGLVIAAVYLYDRRARWWPLTSGLAFGLAILARDKAIIFAGIYGMGLLLRYLAGRPELRRITGQGEIAEAAAPGAGESGRPERPPAAAAPAAGGGARWEDALRQRFGAGSAQALRVLAEAGIFAALALGPYVGWRLFLRHWLHSGTAVSSFNTGSQAAPLSGVLSSTVGTTTRVMYLFVLFIPALICVAMALWAIVRRVWAPPVFLLLLLVQLSVVGLNADFFTDVYGALRVATGLILAATLCLPFFDRVTRGNALWFYACSGGWLLLTVGYALLGPAWFISGRA